MLQFLKIFTVLFFLYFLVSCGSSKKEIDIEDETAETLLQKSNSALEANNYDEVIALDSLLLISFPTSDLHVDAQLNTAKALGGKEKFEDQMDLLLRILKENIIPEKVPLIYVQIAEFYEGASEWNPGTVTNDSMDWAQAAIYYRKAVFYPDSKDNLNKAKALYRAALMYAKLRQIDVARRAYEQTIASYPDTKYSAMAKIKLSDPFNTDEIAPENELLQEYTEDLEVEGSEEELPQIESKESTEQIIGQEIKDMIIDAKEDSSLIGTTPETTEMDEMSPETYEPVEQDTVGQGNELQFEDETEEPTPVESDTTNQGTE